MLTSAYRSFTPSRPRTRPVTGFPVLRLYSVSVVFPAMTGSSLRSQNVIRMPQLP